MRDSGEYEMKKIIALILALIICVSVFAGCNKNETTSSSESIPESESSSAESTESKVAGEGDTVTPEDVVEEGMVPVTGDKIKDGTYDVVVDSSSSMFKITACKLTVEGGKMTAVMTMGGTGYLYIYMGTGEEAAAAAETEYIPFVENEAGEHTFTVPVEALDSGISCAAFSKKKELWYDRTLLFRVYSIPAEALAEGTVKSAADLGIADGEYTCEVTLEGGSGKTTAESPAKIVVKDGKITATVVLSSSKYDYMKVDGVQYFPINTEGNSTFEIPVSGFDWKLPVLGDTTAMSTPKEIEYTLFFDSSTVK
jgi:uncharacterized protein with FMN-binding domain